MIIIFISNFNHYAKYKILLFLLFLFFFLRIKLNDKLLYLYINIILKFIRLINS